MILFWVASFWSSNLDCSRKRSELIGFKNFCYPFALVIEQSEIAHDYVYDCLPMFSWLGLPFKCCVLSLVFSRHTQLFDSSKSRSASFWITHCCPCPRHRWRRRAGRCSQSPLDRWFGQVCFLRRFAEQLPACPRRMLCWKSKRITLVFRVQNIGKWFPKLYNLQVLN